MYVACCTVKTREVFAISFRCDAQLCSSSFQEMPDFRYIKDFDRLMLYMSDDLRLKFGPKNKKN